jgi:hypothetical protein
LVSFRNLAAAAIGDPIHSTPVGTTYPDGVVFDVEVPEDEVVMELELELVLEVDVEVFEDNVAEHVYVFEVVSKVYPVVHFVGTHALDLLT